MTYVVTQSCCADTACVSVCPVDCIHPTADEPTFGQVDMLYIDAAACVDCGACAEVCPVAAIVPDHELTNEDRHFADQARQYFEVAGRKARRPFDFSESEIFRTDEPLRVAIVGTGPSASYAALELLELSANVTMIERLPAFGGLVRYGVAPDHPRTKNASDHFLSKLLSAGVRLVFNCEVGHDISHDELCEHFDAVIYATGAIGGRRLDIPGEELAGVYSASSFVGWYNGHPDFAGLSPDLSARRAVIVGNGNVAIDVARLLLSDANTLSKTDIPEKQAAILAGCGVKEVVILGRRGPAQTAATASELSALGRLAGVDVVVEAVDAELRPPASSSFGEALKLSTLAALGQRPAGAAGKRIVFRYHRVPAAVGGEDHIESLALAETRNPDKAAEHINCGLLIASIGYRGKPLAGVPYDPATGTVPNLHGRVDQAGTYVTGWIKRGPSGVIGTNRQCAAETVQALQEDWRAGRLKAGGYSIGAFEALLTKRRRDWFGSEGWQRIDRLERSEARPGGKRVKLVDPTRMTAVALGQESV